MKISTHLLKMTVTFALLALAAQSRAQVVSSGPIVIEQNTDAAALAAALTSGSESGLTIREANLQGHFSQIASSSGLYSLGEGTANGYGLTRPGVVLSTGNVTDYQSGANTTGNRTTVYGMAATASQETLLDPITSNGAQNFDHFDVTQLDIEFDVTSDKNFVSFFVVFGSEEYAEYVNSQYIDGFGIFLNGQNIALASGKPVNINHPEMSNIAGTELDGVLNAGGSVIMQFTALVEPGSTGNQLTFIVADTSDDLLDTTVYISALESVVPPPPLTISNASIVEGDDGIKNMVFQVELSEEVGLQTVGETVRVSYNTVDVTARAGVDYTATSGLLTFPTGTTVRQITVPILGDTLQEVDETFQVRLSNPIGASFSGQPAMGTILDDDGDDVVRVLASVSDVTVKEGDSGTTNCVFTVMLSCPSSQTVSVKYRTVNGSALQVSDFTAISGTLIFEPGEIKKTVTVMVNGDTLNEANEIFTLLLSAPVNAIIGDDRGLGTILNDDPVTTKISIQDVTVMEGNSGTTAALFEICLSEPSGQTVGVRFTTANSTAIAGSDYRSGAGLVLIPAGQTSRMVSVLVNSDAVVEATEQFFVRLTSPINATILDNQATGTITDNPLPGITIHNASLTEGNEGTTVAEFRVTLAPASQSPVIVGYSTADGTARLADIDYQQTSGVLYFSPGETSKTIEVLVNGDLRNEANETFFVNLSNDIHGILSTAEETQPVTGVLLNTKATGTIVNDDAVMAQICIDDVTVIEPGSGSVNAVFNVVLSEPSGQAIAVKFLTGNGTAVAGNDYAARSGFITFPAGVTARTIVVTVKGDTISENDETFFVNLSGAVNATIEDSQGKGTIINATEENTVTTLSIADASMLEGNSGSTQMVFTVTMPFASEHPVTVNYVTANGTGKTNEDYMATSGTLTFPPGTTNRTISVDVLGDVTHEPNETFFVILTQPQNAVLVKNRATGVILNDDALPKITIHDARTVEGDSGSRYLEFELSLSAASSRNITVNFATADGSARAPASYEARNGILVFPSGTLTQCVAVVICGNVTIESDKTLQMLLSKPVNATILDGTGIGTIVNDDGLPGHLNHFTWSFIASPQVVNQPIPVTITARDRFGDVVPDYSGIVNLTASAASPDEGLHNLLGAPSHTALAGGLRTAGYSFTPKQKMLVTHVRHYSGTKVSIWKNTGQLIASKTVVSSPGIWRETELSSPVVLEAGTTYRVGVLTSGYYVRYPFNGAFSHGTISGFYQTLGDAFPATTISRLPLVDLRYAVYGVTQPVSVIPTESGVFANGIWSGNVILPATADLVTLQADDGFGHTGTSGSFPVLAGAGLSLGFKNSGAPAGGVQLFSASPVSARQTQVFFTPGRGYVIETSPDLVDWTRVFTNRTGRAGSFFVEPAGSGSRFYRAILLPQ